MDIWKSLDGMVEAELTSAEPGAALEAANARGIPLYDVIQVGDLTARFRVRRRDYRTLEALSEKRGETLRLRRRMGAYWTLKRLLARPMLLCGLAVFLAAAIYLPTRIFFVRVEGNVNTPTRLILDAAGENIPYVLSMMGAAELHEEEFSEGMQGQGANAHEHSDHDHGHGENGGGDDAEDEETEYDEHIWTSPVTAMALCRAIGETLCQADPDHADGYRQRLADYLTELESLDQSFRDVVAGGSRRLLVFGDRFPLLYFCREYGLDYRAAFHGCAGDTEPSLATLKYLIDLVNEEHIPVVYTIELSSRKVAEAIAETTGAAVRTFQSCQTVSRADFDNGVTYLQLMEANVDALREGLA